MRYSDFINTLTELSEPKAEWAIQLQALWYDKKGDWKKAHDLVDQLDDKSSAHVHAYLHRVEGDLWNAGYWYRQAGKKVFEGTLDHEWDELVNLFI
ncbi:hypothetical protein ORI89_08800 [Sphingobacterium sp. UT-1RO-CII-1]|uniref:hypothetical protein n=1 Tax=Sphingobacterium sp. UT-1RO-CII-1 TaxID=2995225 RepID=UPI00227BB3CF|nr:hypothetical protein [Sphingobacterium sp. UT-1RO-CII-1]MCY4779749.1 hypothetical protein [Sphingobacterium sp. UT-1RO-CII-1]